jgi:hypothetical protein
VIAEERRQRPKPEEAVFEEALQLAQLPRRDREPFLGERVPQSRSELIDPRSTVGGLAKS